MIIFPRVQNFSIFYVSMYMYFIKKGDNSCIEKITLHLKNKWKC